MVFCTIRAGIQIKDINHWNEQDVFQKYEETQWGVVSQEPKEAITLAVGNILK